MKCCSMDLHFTRCSFYYACRKADIKKGPESLVRNAAAFEFHNGSVYGI